MKKLLITSLLLMMSWTSFCQDTTKAVKVSTLKKIKRDLDKCDSLRVAYKSQTKELNLLIESSALYLERIKQDQLKRQQLQLKIDESVKALRRKKNNWILPTSIGVAGGLITGFIIAK